MFSRRRGDHLHVNAKIRSGMLMIGLCAIDLLREEPTSCEEEGMLIAL